MKWKPFAVGLAMGVVVGLYLALLVWLLGVDPMVFGPE